MCERRCNLVRHLLEFYDEYEGPWLVGRASYARLRYFRRRSVVGDLWRFAGPRGLSNDTSDVYRYRLYEEEESGERGKRVSWDARRQERNGRSSSSIPSNQTPSYTPVLWRWPRRLHLCRLSYGTHEFQFVHTYTWCILERSHIFLTFFFTFSSSSCSVNFLLSFHFYCSSSLFASIPISIESSALSYLFPLAILSKLLVSPRSFVPLERCVRELGAQSNRHSGQARHAGSRERKTRIWEENKNSSGKAKRVVIDSISIKIRWLSSRSIFHSDLSMNRSALITYI